MGRASPRRCERRYVFFLAAAAPGGLRADSLRVLATAEITFAPASP